jgi:proline iminopeptidase
MKTGYIAVEGGSVWYKILGENKNTIPLILIHGGPGATHDYLESLGELSSERMIIFYDQLGSGRSDKPDNNSLWTVDRFAKEIAQIRDALNLDNVHILGQSWGTMLAASYMIDLKPQGVKSLIFSSPALDARRFVDDARAYISELPEQDRIIIRQSEAKHDFDNQQYQDVVMRFYKQHLCRLDPWPDSINRTFQGMNADVYNYMWGPSEFTLTGTLKDFNITEELSCIKAPVLFTCGRYDESTPQATEYYHNRLPGSEFFIFEDCSHMHHIEKQSQYNALIKDFLYRCEKS